MKKKILFVHVDKSMEVCGQKKNERMNTSVSASIGD